MNKIAFLDSGIGGLTVLDSFHKLNKLQNYDEIIYLADLANLPYGGKSLEELTQILLNNLYWLENIKINQVVLACNSSSSLLNQEIKNQFPGINIYNLFDGFSEIQNNFKNINFNKIGIFSTLATHQTNSYKNRLERIFKNSHIYSIPCPKLVPFIESHLDNLNTSEASYILSEYISQLPENIDILFFGCTHYPLLKESIQELLPNTLLIDPGELITSLFQSSDSKKYISLNLYTSSSDLVELQNKVENIKNHLSCVRENPITFGTTKIMERKAQYQ